VGATRFQPGACCGCATPSGFCFGCQFPPSDTAITLSWTAGTFFGCPAGSASLAYVSGGPTFPVWRSALMTACFCNNARVQFSCTRLSIISSTGTELDGHPLVTPVTVNSCSPLSIAFQVQTGTNAGVCGGFDVTQHFTLTS
jgi:hypothetical protein